MIARQIQKSYTADEQKRKVHKLGTICVQNGIDENDLFKMIRDRKSIEDYEWTSQEVRVNGQKRLYPSKNRYPLEQAV